MSYIRKLISRGKQGHKFEEADRQHQLNLFLASFIRLLQENIGIWFDAQTRAEFQFGQPALFNITNNTIWKASRYYQNQATLVMDVSWGKHAGKIYTHCFEVLGMMKDMPNRLLREHTYFSFSHKASISLPAEAFQPVISGGIFFNYRYVKAKPVPERELADFLYRSFPDLRKR